MITYIIETALIWFVFYILYHIFFRKETFFLSNRIFLLSSLILGLVLPLININLNLNQNETLVFVIEQISITDSNTIKDIAQPASLFQEFNLVYLILFAYFIGILFMTLRFLHGLNKIYKLYRIGTKHRLADHILVIIPEEVNPFSFLRFLFVSKSHLTQKEYEIIHSHELKHINDWHSLDIIFVEILRIIFWFNPLVSLYKIALAQSHEYLADKAVLNFTDKKEYGYLLVNMNRENFTLKLANNFINSLIKNRIMMMYKSNSKQLTSIKYLLALPITLFLILLFSCQNEPTTGASNDLQAVAQDKETYSNEIFKVVEDMPRFPGCETEDIAKEEKQKCANNKMLQHLYSNLKYPQSAREKGVEGKVIVQFVVLETGRISDIQIINDLGEGCGDAVVKVVESMNDMEEAWIPGKQGGETVKVQYTLPVKFKLADK